jgi:hypothetical protein
MRKFFAMMLLVVLTGSVAFPRPRQQRADTPQRAPNPINRRVLQDAVLGFYVSQFQQQAEVSSEVFGKILPFLQQFVQDRFDISQRRTRALNQLRQAVQRGAPDEDLKRAVHDFDAADADFQASQEKFLGNVDPLLDARQQAKLRIIQVMADNRMRQLLTNVQNQNRQNRQSPNQ